MEYQTITPHLVLDNAAAAIDFYKAAFGAEEMSRHASPDGKKIMHAHLRIFGMDVMMSDDFPEWMDGKPSTPVALTGSPIVLALRVDDADAAWEKAVAAGAIVTAPLKDQFWGDRYGRFTDPFGHKWSVSQTLKTMSPEAVAAGAKAAGY